ISTGATHSVGRPGQRDSSRKPRKSKEKCAGPTGTVVGRGGDRTAGRGGSRGKTGSGLPCRPGGSTTSGRQASEWVESQRPVPTGLSASGALVLKTRARTSGANTPGGLISRGNHREDRVLRFYRPPVRESTGASRSLGPFKGR